MLKRNLLWLSATAVLIGLPVVAHAGAFTAGDIVVEQIGNGAAALSGSSQAVFLDEYTPTGTLVQSIALPTTSTVGGNQALTESGTATTDGMIELSPNGQYLTVPGYDTGTGTASVASSSGSTVNRTIGLVTSTGVVDTTTHANFFSGNNFRSVVTTDGTTFYVGGTGTSPDKGIEQIAYQGSTTTSINTTAADALSIYNGTLYSTTTASSSTAIVQVGTTGTLPTGSVSETNFTGLPLGSTNDSPHQFVIFNEGGNQVAYLADDTGIAITKYELISGTWTAEGKVGTGGNDMTGLTGSYNPSTGAVTLFATELNGDSTSGAAALFVTITDSSGAGGTLSGSLTTLATAGTNETFAGVAFAPVAAPEPASMVLAAIGLLGLAGYGWRRNRAA
ncbi:MAG TPA: PEP-CTERM sorting domain-containing protein [Pirellulales bacterium]|nr:PEP-CTERM sorting domain-containing protein [Pirellulales bacterium]